MQGKLLQAERGEVVLDFGQEEVIDGPALLRGRAEGGQEPGEGVLWEGREGGGEGGREGGRGEMHVCSCVKSCLLPSLPPSLPALPA
jgi:hypothetical protein